MTMTNLKPRLVTTVQARELLAGLDEDTIRALVRSGELHAVKIPSKPGVEARKIRITVASIDAYVARLAGEQAEAEA